MKNKTQEQIREGIEILDRNRNSSLVQRVVKGDTQFQREVVGFYGINPKGEARVITHRGFPTITIAIRGHENKKDGKYPINLVEILDEFGSNPLNSNLLVYEDVRSSYGVTSLKGKELFLDMSLLDMINPLTFLKLKAMSRELKILRESKVESKREFEELYNRSIIADSAAGSYRKNLLENALERGK